jgi:D-sedoheptulose 7-phosphate isomerase
MSKLDVTADEYFKSHVRLFEQVDGTQISKAVQLIKRKFQEGRAIFTCGNGGSASTASHFITDWNKMINLATGKKFRGVSLCDNVGLITAFANDISFSEIFVGQLKSLMTEGDLLVAISGSGNSDNVVNAIKYANETGGETLAIVGYNGGNAAKLANHVVHIPSYDMQLCEDIHLMFGHIVMKNLANCPLT